MKNELNWIKGELRMPEIGGSIHKWRIFSQSKLPHGFSERALESLGLSLWNYGSHNQYFRIDNPDLLRLSDAFDGDWVRVKIEDNEPKYTVTKI